MHFSYSKKIFFLLILVGSLFFKNINLYSEIALTIKDTSIYRGIVNSVQLRGTIDESPLNDISLVFSFDSRIIDIKSANGSPTYSIRNATPVFTLDFNRIDSAIVSSSSDSVQQISNGIILNFNVEGLVFSDSITTIKLEAVYINGNKSDNFSFTGGKIKVLGQAFLSHLPDAIGNCTPNPFIAQTHVDFSLEDNSKLQFHIYNTLGRLVSTSDENNYSTFVAINLDKSGIINSFHGEIEKGNYRLILTPVSWDFSQGLYYLVMKTDKGSYVTNFMYFKR